MIAGLYDLATITSRFKYFIIPSIFFVILIFYPSNAHSAENKLPVDSTSDRSTKIGVIYSNPQVYNVDYSFELFPDPAKIDRTKDLKLWLPIPREWDSQKAVKIISIYPSPHETFEDPEHGNKMLYWDFSKQPEDSSYKVKVKCRLESFEIHTNVDPENIGTYDKTSREYKLYTRSTHTISITPKIRELAQIAIGEETNPYLQAQQILEYTGKKVNYKILDYERGRGIKCLLDYPVIDEDTGEEYYEGCCTQKCAFFIALCRAMGIPARSAYIFTGYKPWLTEEDLKPKYKFETELSPDGLAGIQHFGHMGCHMVAEFYIPDYGWIPTDPTSGRFGNLGNKSIILSKGRDIIIGPEAPQKHNEGYGSQWVPLHEGRADMIFSAVYNIEKIHIAKMKILIHPDPFPADALAGYPIEDMEKDNRVWRKKVLSRPSYLGYYSKPESLNFEQIYRDHPKTKYEMEPLVCHMLHRQLGDERFFNLVKTYVDLRQKSNQPVSTSYFQNLAEDVYGESLDWFFKQWVNNKELPRLKLEYVAVREDKEGWQIKGRLLQLSDTIFRFPIELAINTKMGRENRNLWIDKNSVDFDFDIQNKPQKLVVDPDYEILKLQKMAPRLWWFWDVYPNYIIIYGTLAESQSNKLAAERLNKDYLGLGEEIIKADTEISQDSLKNKCVFLIGRPETNKMAQEFKEIFPIKFDGDRFTWKGITYDQPTQGISQIIENPIDPKNLMIMYAGLSGEATQKFCDLYLYDSDASYVIFDVDKQLVSDDWEEFDSDLVWKFE